MIVVLEKIDEIQLALVFLSLDGVRLDNQDISSSAHQLAKHVLANCTLELTPKLYNKWVFLWTTIVKL